MAVGLGVAVAVVVAVVATPALDVLGAEGLLVGFVVSPLHPAVNANATTGTTAAALRRRDDVRTPWGMPEATNAHAVRRPLATR